MVNETLYQLQRKLSLMKAHAATTAKTAPVFTGTRMRGRTPFGKLLKHYSSKLLESIEGSLLGDAGLQLQYSGKTCNFTVNQSTKHLGSLHELWPVLKELEPGLREPYSTSPNEVRLITRVHPVLLWFFSRWYTLNPTYVGGRPKKGDAKKVVPKDIAITPTVMFWEHLWDGSLEENWGYYDIRLSASCFTQPELEFLVERIYKESGMAFKIRYVKGYPQLDLFGGTRSTFAYLNYIMSSGCKIPECFAYKFKAVHLKRLVPTW